MPTDSVVVSRLRIALHESQTEVSEVKAELAKLKAAHELLLLQVAPMRLLARTADWVERLATRGEGEVDEAELSRAFATQAQALNFYREAMDTDRMTDISQHFDRVVSLRAAQILETSEDSRARSAAKILKRRARTNEPDQDTKPRVRIYG